MSRLAGRVSVVAAALAAGAPAAVAAPVQGPHEVVDISYSTSTPGVPAAIHFAATYRDPSDPSGTPPALRRVTIVGPAGARLDTSVPPRCDASDMQLEMQGEAACPAGSRVGAGHIVGGPIGLPPQPQDVAVFNATDQQVQLVKFGNGGSAVARGMIHGETTDTVVPTCLTGGQAPKDCPFDQTVLLSSTFDYPARVEGGRAYFTTPPACPPSGAWETRATFTYADGAVETLTTAQPCVQPPAPAAPAACVIRRRFAIHLPHGRYRSASLTVAGRRETLDPRHAIVDLRGLPRGRYLVRIVAVTQAGSRVVLVRRYRTCTPGSG